MISYIFLAIFFGLWYYLTKKPSVPKGLKPLPSPSGARFYFGHYGLLGSKPHETLTRWSKELNSEIYSIKMGRLNFVILNSDKVVGDLLQKRGAIYSSRIDSEYFFHCATRGASLGSSPYNDYYKKVKAMVAGTLTSQKIETFSPLVDKITKEMLLEIINVSTSTSSSNPEPINPSLYLRRTTLNVVLDVTFGIYTTSINDPLFKRLNKWTDDFTEMYNNVARKLEYFPILKYHPKNRSKQDAMATRDEIDSMFGEFFETIKSNKNQHPCAAREAYEQGELEDYQIVHLFSGIVFAGTDTVASSLAWLLAFLANNPSFQEPAHKELDTLLPNHDRLPTFADSKNLPYIRALIREGQRVFPPIWMGVHHCIEQDDEYNGYHIPANSLVFINLHAIGFDERRYKNATEFDPYRFINVEQSMAGLATGPAEKRDQFSFGAGRRLCVGIHLAEHELFVILSRILYCFRIENASPTGEDGKPIPIDLTKGTAGFTTWPIDHKIRFVPRYDWTDTILK